MKTTPTKRVTGCWIYGMVERMPGLWDERIVLDQCDFDTIRDARAWGRKRLRELAHATHFKTGGVQ